MYWRGVGWSKTKANQMTGCWGGFEKVLLRPQAPLRLCVWLYPYSCPKWNSLRGGGECR